MHPSVSLPSPTLSDSSGVAALEAARTPENRPQVASRPESLPTQGLSQAMAVPQPPVSLHRLRLQRLDADLLRQSLVRWCDYLSPALETQMAQASPSQALFDALAHQLLSSAQLSLEHSKVDLGCSAEPLDTTAPWSPDGTHLVIPAGWRPGGVSAACHLWRQEATGVHRLAVLPLGKSHPLGVTFSADSRRLWCFDQSGYLHHWQRQADGVWHTADGVRLSPRRDSVIAVRFSPDARSLIAMIEERMVMFAEHRPGVWQQDCSLRWIDDRHCSSYHHMFGFSPPRLMRFSADSRHCLVLNGGSKTFVFDWNKERWQVQPILDGKGGWTYETTSLLAPQGGWLALASTRQAGGYDQGRHAQIDLWRYGPDHHKDGKTRWHFFESIVCPGPAGERELALAFSPDCRQLAWPERLENGVAGVAVRRWSEAGGWQLAARLQIGPGLEVPHRRLAMSWDPLERSDVFCLEYNAHGDVLAAVTGGGVQLWRLADGLWTPAVWIENLSEEVKPVLRFAPDGYHCALANGRVGEVSLLGPDPEKRTSYRTKAAWTHWKKVVELVWASDGSRLALGDIAGSFSSPSVLHFLTIAPDRRQKRSLW